MASHEVGRVDLIGRVNGRIAETQVRTSEATRLLRVVREVCLTVFIGVVTNDFNRVLVGSNGSVCAQSVEFSFENAFASHRYFGHGGQRSKRNVVYNAHGKVVLWYFQFEVVEHGEYLSRRSVRRTQSITSAND